MEGRKIFHSAESWIANGSEGITERGQRVIRWRHQEVEEVPDEKTLRAFFREVQVARPDCNVSYIY